MNIENDIKEIWEEPLFTTLTEKKLNTSKYKELRKEIPDDFITIEEVFPKEEIEEIWDNYKPYLSEDEIFPFLGTLGEAVICIGYGKENKGKIFYFDFDFGKIQLDHDNLSAFIEKLEDNGNI